MVDTIDESRDDFELELAWDGHRVLVSCVGEDMRFVSEDYRQWSDAFPTLPFVLRRLGVTTLALEGWICAMGTDGRPSFDALRAHVAREKSSDIVLALTDLFHLNGEDLAPLPLRERRARLAALLSDAPDALIFSASLEGSARELRASLARLSVPGFVARARGAPHSAASNALVVPSGVEPVRLERSLSAPVKITNKDKVLYPRDGVTKENVIAYYANVASVLLPYLDDRPVVLQRWPDGIDEFTWYQHRMPPRAPDYLRAVFIDGNRRIVIPNRDALLWMVNQAVLTLHGWASRVTCLGQPDWVVIDLDPGENTSWADTIAVALAVRRLLELCELESVIKTSGQKGLHVLVPLAPGQSPTIAHEFARRAAQMIARLLPDVVSLEVDKEKRKGRLFLDHLQNYVGKSLVLPYSLRAADGAPVSTPLEWSEVTESLDPRAFTLRTLRARLDKSGDLAEPLLTGTALLAPIVAKLDP